MVYILVVLTLRSMLAHSDGLSSYLSVVFEDPSSAMNGLVKMPSKTCTVTREAMKTKQGKSSRRRHTS